MSLETLIQSIIHKSIRRPYAHIVDDKITIHASELTQCNRKLWYKHIVDIDVDADKHNVEVMSLGEYCHRLFIDWCKMSGIWAGDNIKVGDASLRIRGYIDVRVRINDELYPIEIKSVSEKKYKEYCKSECNVPEFIAQLNTYLVLGDYKAGFICLFNRNTAEWRLFYRERDNNLWSYIVDKIKVLHQCIESKTLPKRDNNTSMCKYCEYWNICWKSDKYVESKSVSKESSDSCDRTCENVQF